MLSSTTLFLLSVRQLVVRTFGPTPAAVLMIDGASCLNRPYDSEFTGMEKSSDMEGRTCKH